MITLFYSDEVEHKILLPLKYEFEVRGYGVKFSNNFDEPSEIGIYACHTNYFGLSKSGGWYKPPSNFSVICLHDLYHDNGDREYMFSNDSWDVFDLGLVPGERWLDIYRDGVARGFNGPKYGVRKVGWPVSDQVFNIQSHSARDNLTSSLGLDASKKTILLGASWLSKSMIEDCLVALDLSEYNFVIKIVDWTRTEFGDSPWEKIFSAQVSETQKVINFAKNNFLKVAPFDINISELIGAADLVLSNGSNIMFEALIQNKPSICIKEWFHPYGDKGQFKHYPSVDIPGVLNGSKEYLNTYIEAAFLLANSPLVKVSGEIFVDKSMRGKGAELSVEAILDAYQNRVKIENIRQLSFNSNESEISVLQAQLLSDKENMYDETDILQVKSRLVWVHNRMVELENECKLAASLIVQNADLSEQITALKNSTSWRITRPLRKIREFLLSIA